MIQLTTALDMGAVDVDYTHVKIVSFSLHSDSKWIRLDVRYGYLDGQSNWVTGKEVDNVTKKQYNITGSDYATLIAATSAAGGEVYYDEVARELYEWLQANHAEYAGTIV